MSTRVKAYAVLALAAVLTIATSQALHDLRDTEPLAERVLTPDDPFYPISGSIETVAIDAERIVWKRIDVMVDASIAQPQDAPATIRLYKLPSRWMPEEGVPSDDLIVSSLSLTDQDNSQPASITGRLYAYLETVDQEFHLLMVLNGDPTVTLKGEVVVTVSIPYSEDYDLPEDAEVVLHLE